MELRAAGFVIYRRMFKEIEYLLMQTSYGEHHWTPPKGHVDKGESDYDAALRETLEEAGYCEGDLRIESNFTKVLKYEVNGKPKIVTYWLAELCVNKPVTLSPEHQDFKWVKLSEACKLSKYVDMKKLLEESTSLSILANLPNWNSRKLFALRGRLRPIHGNDSSNK